MRTPRGDETIRCELCDQLLSNQEVHMYLDVNASLDEIMCKAYWKKEEAKG